MDQPWFVFQIVIRFSRSYSVTGPLLWHWENNTTNDISIELDMEEVKALAKEIGFDISVDLLYLFFVVDPDC